jgi:hypothetical protein
MDCDQLIVVSIKKDGDKVTATIGIKWSDENRYRATKTITLSQDDNGLCDEEASTYTKFFGCLPIRCKFILGDEGEITTHLTQEIEVGVYAYYDGDELKRRSGSGVSCTHAEVSINGCWDEWLTDHVVVINENTNQTIQEHTATDSFYYPTA